MKERWLVTLNVKFITLHKSNIRHYERKYSLMFQKLYSVSLITKQANCKTCYWRWLEWNFLCISQIWNYHFLLIGTTVLFNTQLWRKLFLQQLIFRSKNLTQKQTMYCLSYQRSSSSWESDRIAVFRIDSPIGNRWCSRGYYRNPLISMDN